MKYLNVDKFDKSFINDNIKLFIRFCKIHGLYNNIIKHYTDIFHLYWDLNDRRMSSYVSHLLMKDNITSEDYADFAFKKQEREKNVEKFSRYWNEFAKNQIKKNDEYHTERLLEQYRKRLTSSFYGSYGSNSFNDFFPSYCSTDLGLLNRQILTNINGMIYNYVDNDTTNLNNN